MNGTRVTVRLRPWYYERLEEIARSLNKSIEDAAIYILEVRMGMREDELSKPGIGGGGAV